MEHAPRVTTYMLYLYHHMVMCSCLATVTRTQDLVRGEGICLPRLPQLTYIVAVISIK